MALTPPLALSSEAGMERLKDAGMGSDGSIVDENLVQRFREQLHCTFCGPASLAIAWDMSSETEPFAAAVPCLGKEVVCNMQKRSKVSGFTLNELAELASACGALAIPTSASLLADEQITRRSLIAVLEKSGKVFCIVNYDMTVTGQPPYKGHFSPVAAYHEKSDSFLVLDVWPQTSGPVWISAPVLHAAMRTVDTASSTMRGFLAISALPSQNAATRHCPRMAIAAAASNGSPERVALMVNKAYEMNTRVKRRGAKRTDAASIEKIFQSSKDELILLLVDDVICGCIHTRPSGWGMLSIDPDYQGKGLGILLLLAGELSCITQMRCSEINICFVNIQTETGDWYQRQGYIPYSMHYGNDNWYAHAVRADLSRDQVWFIDCVKKLK